MVNIEFQFHKGETDAINAMTAAIDAFNAANPGIHVEMNTAGDTNSMVARSQQDDLPDIFACQTSATFEKMFAAGQLMDLTGQDFLNNIVEGTLALSTYEGKNWRLPYSLSCYGLYIRTDIFEEQGLAWPTTWAELMDVCEKLKAAGIWGFANPDKDMVYQRMERMMSMLSDNDDEFKAIAAGEMEAKDLCGRHVAEIDICLDGDKRNHAAAAGETKGLVPQGSDCDAGLGVAGKGVCETGVYGTLRQGGLCDMD